MHGLENAADGRLGREGISHRDLGSVLVGGILILPERIQCRVDYGDVARPVDPEVTLIPGGDIKRPVRIGATDAYRVAEGAVAASCGNGSTATRNVAARAIGFARGDIVAVAGPVLAGREQRGTGKAAEMGRFVPDRV